MGQQLSNGHLGCSKGRLQGHIRRNESKNVLFVGLLLCWKGSGVEQMNSLVVISGRGKRASDRILDASDSSRLNCTEILLLRTPWCVRQYAVSQAPIPCGRMWPKVKRNKWWSPCLPPTNFTISCVTI